MTKTVRKDQKLRQFLISFFLSVFIVGVLLGNAYILTSIGYPNVFLSIGKALFLVGFVAIYPPGVVFLGLAKLGIVPELRGRESFIVSNPVLWIFCVIFYMLVIYFICRLWHWHRWRKSRVKLTDTGKDI